MKGDGSYFSAAEPVVTIEPSAITTFRPRQLSALSPCSATPKWALFCDMLPPTVAENPDTVPKNGARSP